MKHHILAATALAITTFAAPALAADAPAPATATPPAPAAAAGAVKYTSADTPIGTLLDDPAAKAVLVKHMAPFVANPQIEMARSLTLKQIQGYAGDAITDDTLAKIDADLAKIK
jgi:hypothetical protein